MGDLFCGDTHSSIVLSALSTPLTLPRLELDEDDDVAVDDDGDDTGDGGDEDDDVDDDADDTGDFGDDEDTVVVMMMVIIPSCCRCCPCPRHFPDPSSSPLARWTHRIREN